MSGAAFEAKGRRAADSVPGQGGLSVRWLYLAIVVVFVAALIIFVVQNTETVSVSFLDWAISAPLALVVFVVYVLGAMTGGSLYGLLRRSVAGSRRVSRA
jgi:lipopolysaccharide assembly protein A